MKPLDADRYESLGGGPSFSLGNRLFRFAWAAVWFVFASWTPPFFHAWRRFLLRVFGAKIASTANIYGSVRIWYPPNLEMAPYSCLGPHVNCYCMAKVSMGPYALVSQGAHLCAGTHDIEDPNFQLFAKPIEIGARAWIAAEAFVGPGVVVGEGAVLGARAVTFSDLAPWMVYVGNPAHRRKERRRIE